jgi:hypothetical protein
MPAAKAWVEKSFAMSGRKEFQSSEITTQEIFLNPSEF